MIAIVSCEIQCPRCNRYHVDREEWWHRPHHTHLCEHCGNEFEWSHPLYRYTRGKVPTSITGRLRLAKHALADKLYALLTTGVTTNR